MNATKRQRVRASSVYIGGKLVDVGEVSYHETGTPPGDEGGPDWPTLSTTNVSCEVKMSHEQFAELHALIERSFLGGRPGHRRRIPVRHLHETGPHFCGLCVALGRAQPIPTLYGLRMHMAQGRHGHRGFPVSKGRTS